MSSPIKKISDRGVVFSDEHRIPVAEGQAVSPGWTAATGGRPLAVTWHWTATWDLVKCDRLLGGADATRRGQASAHYGVGRSFKEGVHRYVSLEDRAWHAGKHQTVRWDGRPLAGPELKGSRTSIGIETVNVGYARRGIPAVAGWLPAASPNSRWKMRIQPWSAEQVTMMIAVGREIVARWPNIGPRDHHGHLDLCPGYKHDPAAFPFATVLRGIYRDPRIPDVWTPLWGVRGRQRALLALGYDLGGGGVSGTWDRACDRALRRLQREGSLAENGMWSTFVCWRVHDLLVERGLVLKEVAGTAAHEAAQG